MAKAQHFFHFFLELVIAEISEDLFHMLKSADEKEAYASGLEF